MIASLEVDVGMNRRINKKQTTAHRLATQTSRPMRLCGRRGLTLGIIVAVLSGCEPSERPDELSSGDAPEAPAEEPSSDKPRLPVFAVEPGAKGPLTLDALNVDYDALSFAPSEAERKCIDARIESRLAEVGDPAFFDPETTELFATPTSRETWRTFDSKMRRILIAQAVVHRSLNECT